MPGLGEALAKYISAFMGGALTSFTPCVYPLIPIIIGVIGAGKEKSRLRKFILSLSYCLGLALTFSILGLVAALSGRLFGQVQASPLAHIIVGVIFIIFGLSLLDVIVLPTFLLNKIGLGKVKKTGGLLAAFLMGLASGLVAVPCTTAILGAILTYAAVSQNAIFGFTLLFSFALGLSALLILIGTFTGIVTSLKRCEKWMHIIQKALAFGIIILGIYFVILPFSF